MDLIWVWREENYFCDEDWTVLKCPARQANFG
jgi:hypothetical protein